MITITGYTRQCKDTLGGVKKIYLQPYIKYNNKELKSSNDALLVYPNSVVYDFECEGSFTQSSNFQDEAHFIEQNIELLISKPDEYFNKSALYLQDYRIIILTNNDILFMFGARNGMRGEINNDPGNQKNTYNGYRVIFKGKEEFPALRMTSLGDYGITVSQ